ncbi:MAG: hypothetical protein LHV69_06795 [Elusimicrobia bacterium]|nr:hypothetical protein [Candidatus Obscuribacterium magneticum]
MRTGLKIIIATSLLLGVLGRAQATLYSVGLDKNNYTTDFMIGQAVVAIIFPESDGSNDPDSETWSDDRKAQVIGKIMAAHSWWAKQNPRGLLNFTYVIRTVPTKYEPITRPYYQESLWIPDVLEKLGYPGSRFSACKNYINALREEYNADWGFLIFVVDSLNDTNGKLADGYFAYAYLGGPFMVMTYDNAGYGIGNMDVVCAHETGHIFYALDQYAGASSPSDTSSGYFPTINGNHVYSAIATEPNSIMRGGLRWGLDDWARQMVGWRDLDNNGLEDILDQNPSVNVSKEMSQAAAGKSKLTGQAAVLVLPRQENKQGYGFTLNTIAKVQFRFGTGEWAEAQAADGAFDNPTESFVIEFPSPMAAQAINIQSLEVRALTDYVLNTPPTPGTSGSVRRRSAGAASLAEAHAYPNPFKPRSNLGHTEITFTGLTSGARVQVFTPAGEPVYDATTDDNGSSLSWRGVDKDGSIVASGVYFYLITDPTGHKREGKLTILR